MTITNSSHQVEILRAQYISEVEVLAAMLRRAADVVERHGNEIRANLSDMQPDYLASATDILNDINVLHGNMNTPRLISSAREIDMEVRKLQNQA